MTDIDWGKMTSEETANEVLNGLSNLTLEQRCAVIKQAFQLDGEEREALLAQLED